MSFDVIGVGEENELEVYLMAQAAFEMQYGDISDSKDLKIRLIEKELRELRAKNSRLREQISREKRLKK